MDSIKKNEILTFKIIAPITYTFIVCILTAYSYQYSWDYAFKYLLEKPLNIVIILIFTYILPRITFLDSPIKPTKKQNIILYVLTVITFILGIYMSVPLK